MNLQEALSQHPCFVVYDRNVRDFVGTVVPDIDARPSFGIVADEAHKDIGAVMDICRFLLENGADRDAVLIAVGGGITSDMVGFAASIYKRGVRFGIVPTTLLSMVDASIGGKTGVNLDGLKNMLGSFREPEFTHIALSALQTLPEREFRAGAAELLKTFIISDARLYEKAVTVLSAPEPSVSDIAPLIEEAVRIKTSVVRRDPLEKGLRRILNLGHTWAHAIEWKSGGKIIHGEAVAMGIIAAARMSEALGVAREGLASRYECDFKACGLPVESPFPDSELLAAMIQDKKAENGSVNMVLLKRTGKPVVVKYDLYKHKEQEL